MEPRLYTREDGKKVLESQLRGQQTRYIEGGGSQIEVPVDGVLKWRNAHWVNTEVGRLYSKYGSKTDFAPELQPIYDAKKERLDKSATDGSYSITTLP